MLTKYDQLRLERSEFLKRKKLRSFNLDFVHIVFGKACKGMDVVDKIAATEVGEGYKPLDYLVIQTIEKTEAQ